MSEKVKLPREVAEAMNEFRDTYAGYEWMVLSEIIRSDEADRKISHTAYTLINYAKQSEPNFVRILKALVNGYVVEDTPEDKVREYFESMKNDIGPVVIKHTLGLLNIKIPGVNADE